MMNGVEVPADSRDSLICRRSAESGIGEHCKPAFLTDRRDEAVQMVGERCRLARRGG
jgi:hypothetical protein